MSLPELAHVYRAAYHANYDGDTLDVVPSQPVRLRLLGVDSAEMRGGTEETKKVAREQKQWVQEWMYAARDRTRVDGRINDVFGRQLAYVYREDNGTCLNDDFLYVWGDEYRYDPRAQVMQARCRVHFDRAELSPSVQPVAVRVLGQTETYELLDREGHALLTMAVTEVDPLWRREEDA